MKIYLLFSYVIVFVAGIMVSKRLQKKKYIEKIDMWHQLSDKHFELFILMILWMKKKQEGKNISNYFAENKYNSIAIYGMSYVGECLVSELDKTGIEVKFALDRNLQKSGKIKILSPDKEIPEVDVIVVTAISYFNEIQSKLMKNSDIPVISLKDILLLL